MVLEFVGAIVLGIAVAGTVMLIRKVTGPIFPAYIIPMAAALGALIYSIWSDYTWYERTAGQLPDDIIVFAQQEMSLAFQPWTYLVPRTFRFEAINKASGQQVYENPRVEAFELIQVTRRAGTRRSIQLLDCSNARIADANRQDFDFNDFKIDDAQWFDLDENHSLLDAACDP